MSLYKKEMVILFDKNQFLRFSPVEIIALNLIKGVTQLIIK